MASTTNLALPYPALSDSANVPTHIQNLASTVDTKLADLFTVRTYTPAVTATTTAPGLGTGGTAVGTYMIVGRLVFVNIILTLGTGPTAGSGVYSVSLPSAAAANSMLATGVIPGTFQTSQNQRVPVVGTVSGSTLARINIPFYSATGPTYGQSWGSGTYAIGGGTLAAGDVIVFTGTYLKT